MSFSSKVKREIFEAMGPRHCRIAELSAIIDNCGGSANALARAKYKKLAEMDFGSDTQKMLQACAKGAERAKGECCKKSYIRGAYLAGGTMADPRGRYHMEFAASEDCIAQISRNFAFFGLAPKSHMRKNQQILYFKEAEQIATVLSIIGAHVALMEFENCRVDKHVNNAINRASNAAAANADRVIAASAKHIKDIMDIQNLAGLSALDEGLLQVAQIRLDNPLLGLEEIGKKLVPPISKSGVNHRLKKIAQLAESYRQYQMGVKF